MFPADVDVDAAVDWSKVDFDQEYFCFAIAAAENPLNHRRYNYICYFEGVVDRQNYDALCLTVKNELSSKGYPTLYKFKIEKEARKKLR